MDPVVVAVVVDQVVVAVDVLRAGRDARAHHPVDRGMGKGRERGHPGGDRSRGEKKGAEARQSKQGDKESRINASATSATSATSRRAIRSLARSGTR